MTTTFRRPSTTTEHLFQLLLKKNFSNGSTTPCAPLVHIVITPSANTVTFVGDRTITWQSFLSLLSKSQRSALFGTKGSARLVKSQLRERGIWLDIRQKSFPKLTTTALEEISNPNSELHRAVHHSVRRSLKIQLANIKRLRALKSSRNAEMLKESLDSRTKRILSEAGLLGRSGKS